MPGIAGGLGDASDDLAHADELHGRALATLQAGEREEVFDHPTEPRVLTGDKFEILACLRRIRRVFFQQGFDEHTHRGQWRAQLMRDGGGEFLLKLRPLELLLHVSPSEAGEQRKPERCNATSKRESEGAARVDHRRVLFQG